MWVRCNPNPKRKHVPDCVIRALAIVLNETWYKIYDDLYVVGREEANVSCADEVWGIYLRMYGFDPFMLPDSCPRCVTIREFTKHFPKGRYVIGTQNQLDAERGNNQSLRFAASQGAQTAQIVANNEAQTVALEQYLAPTPRPAYIVPNPNCCPNQFGYNMCGYAA